MFKFTAHKQNLKKNSFKFNIQDPFDEIFQNTQHFNFSQYFSYVWKFETLKFLAFFFCSKIYPYTTEQNLVLFFPNLDDFTPLVLEKSETERASPRVQVPPHIGIGTEADTLHNWDKLEPVPPPKQENLPEFRAKDKSVKKLCSNFFPNFKVLKFRFKLWANQWKIFSQFFSKKFPFKLRRNQCNANFFPKF